MRLPQAPPFRYVDRLVERGADRSCVAIKRFSAGEEGEPPRSEVPFSRVLEALCQAAALIPAQDGTGGRILKIEDVQLSHPVQVGDTLTIRCALLEETDAALRARSVGEVEGRVVAGLTVLVGRVPAEEGHGAAS